MAFAQSPKRPRPLAPEEPCLACVAGPHACDDAREEGEGPAVTVCDPLMLALGVWATKEPEGYIPPKQRRRTG